MYGMVHEALGDFVRTRADAAAWERTCERAGSPVQTFPTLTPYPDALSFGLVVEAAAELGMDLDAMMVEFGRHWIGYALGTAYGPLLRSAGGSLTETLAALDRMHARIASTFPDLRPPSFSVEENGQAITLHYISIRDGLAPFVVGLVEGLAAMHGTSATVQQIAAKADGAAHDQFLVRVAA